MLAHLYPDADVPVVQLSINALKPMDYHVELGAKLSAFGDRGVMVVASGNVVHNLRRVDRNRSDGSFDWNWRFDEAVERHLADNPAPILRTMDHFDYDQAVPTPDHFIPLLYTAGLAAEEGSAKALVRGYAMGSLSMTCYGVGVERKCPMSADGAATILSSVPVDQSNI